ncbi:unnamed protein product [Rotaria magnacalcarata]|uniref:Uncharacterized protein n=2 Tax=Rotaria magnacalcarata TaxID=392030 RepID=A0A816CQ74_9BILA|nr:unnamed protein product [Rotaria magnacalcarata]CAF3961660.1 unnamed protein product [Rotaria magnacalcarata]CAF4299948.1 unnamed protein product [Rotaria magnacalcarata]CAF4617489.1 unnamed protein product [Rotaria magnacalcarata]
MALIDTITMDSIETNESLVVKYGLYLIGSEPNEIPLLVTVNGIASSSSETESQSSIIPVTPPNASNKNTMQVIIQELKALNKKLDTWNTRMIATNDLMVIMNDKLTSAQRVMLGFMVVSSAAIIIVALKK